jgi:hypothetical protein
MGMRFMSKMAKNSTKVEIKQDQKIMEGISLNYFSTSSNVRRLCYRIVNYPFFSKFMLTTILVTSIQLALESPLNHPKSSLMKTIFWIDIITTMIFAIEGIMKIIAFGFIKNGVDSYA